MLKSELRALPRQVQFGEIAEFDRVDDRVSIVNTAFGNLVGVNKEFVEFCPNQEPPSEAELVAWAWLLKPGAVGHMVGSVGGPFLLELIRERYWMPACGEGP